MMPLSKEEIAGFYWLALRLDLVGPAAVVAWADSVIESSERPDIQIIDLSLSAHRPVDAVLDQLSCIRGDALMPVRMIACLLLRRIEAGLLSECDAARLLYRLYWLESTSQESLGLEVCCIDEYFEDYSTMSYDEAAREVREFLGRHGSLELPPH